MIFPSIAIRIDTILSNDYASQARIIRILRTIIRIIDQIIGGSDCRIIEIFDGLVELASLIEVIGYFAKDFVTVQIIQGFCPRHIGRCTVGGIKLESIAVAQIKAPADPGAIGQIAIRD